MRSLIVVSCVRISVRRRSSSARLDFVVGRRDLVVEGRFVVRGGEVVTVDLPIVVERQRRLAARLMG